ncbi:hypothetical protein G6F57_023731 [Rhizopus arrhizus]|nr:hypothetical protein G6F57_023731 [Rhizopus arrhizus]
MDGQRRRALRGQALCRRRQPAGNGGLHHDQPCAAMGTAARPEPGASRLQRVRPTVRRNRLLQPDAVAGRRRPARGAQRQLPGLLQGRPMG